jgi:hypothetical protein
MLNYNVAGGIYANHAADWMYEAIDAAHPTCDWAAFEAWFAEEHTFAEIEDHPSFCIPIEHDPKGATIMTGDLTHADVEVLSHGDDSAVPVIPDVDGDEYRVSLDDARKELRKARSARDKAVGQAKKADGPSGTPQPGDRTKRKKSATTSKPLRTPRLDIKPPRSRVYVASGGKAKVLA